MKIAVVGAGWAGMSAAIRASHAGHAVAVYEASRQLGGRARALPCDLPNGVRTTVDNGQHILIGAYSETLKLLRLVGVDPEQALLRLPLALVYADGGGLEFPGWPAPLDALGGIARARGWTLSDKLSLLRTALRWRLAGFRCGAGISVASLCRDVNRRVMQELLEPLCVSALNTAAAEASGQVFLRVLHDAMFGASGGSNLLLPRVDLSTLFPHAAATWLTGRGGEIHLGARVQRLAAAGEQWRVNDEVYDLVVLATGASDAVATLSSALASVAAPVAARFERWSAIAGALEHVAITTVYAWGQDVTLPRPMLALRSGDDNGSAAPAQFVFDRGRLGGPGGLLAFVVSASAGDKAGLQAQVLAQAQRQLGFDLQPVQTIVEKRATFACTPGLQRPASLIAPGLLAGADFVDGPYPSTLEGAVRAGSAAIQSSGFAF